MWGEALFNIEDTNEQYIDYLNDQLNTVKPIEGHSSKFRVCLEELISEIDKLQDKLDLHDPRTARHILGLSASKEEPQETLQTLMHESQVKNSEYGFFLGKKFFFWQLCRMNSVF